MRFDDGGNSISVGSGAGATAHDVVIDWRDLVGESVGHIGP